MKAIIALSFAAVALAAPDSCQEANAYAKKFAGDCNAVAACFDNAGNAGWANDAFSITGFSNDGYVSNVGAANDGAMANDGALANDGAVSNDGFVTGNIGFELNDAFANAGFVSVFCQDLYNCGAFETEFANCFASATAIPAPTVTVEVAVCEELFLGDGVCDEICNFAEFNYDGGDCAAPTTTAEETATETESA